MSHDVSATAANRGQQNAVANARERVVKVRDAVGTAHPEHASALIQLALLLIMHGDPNEAEPLLREALDIRRATLGERHPEYATCLSSLAGLLWARGDLDAAEPLLRQALAVRCEVLGERHPKSIVSQNSLDQLLQAKKAWDSAAQLDAEEHPPAAPPESPVVAEAAPDPEPAPSEESAEAAVSPEASTEPEPQPDPEEAAAPEPAAQSESTPETPAEPALATPPMAAVDVPTPFHPEPALATGQTREELLVAVDELGEHFAGLGGELHGAVGRLNQEGVLPGESLIQALHAGRSRFTAVHGAILHLASSLGMADAESRPATSLHDLGELLAELERYELERSRAGQARRQALAALERIGRLAYADRKDFPPLRECQDAALGLHERIAAARPAELPDEAFALADGAHAYNALLALADADAGLSDEEWANALERVQSELGKPISVAAARSKIVAGPAA